MTLPLAVLALVLPLAAAAGDWVGATTSLAPTSAFVSEGLRQAALAHPYATLHVIVVGQPGIDAGRIKNDLMKDARGNQFGDVRREFRYALDGVAADMTGAQLLQLAAKRGIKSITPDTPVKRLAVSPARWREAVNLTGLSSAPSSEKPVAIAVVDTGVDKDRKEDFGGRVIQSQEFASLEPRRGSATDYSGHGTIVAGIAAGASASHPGELRGRHRLAACDERGGQGDHERCDRGRGVDLREPRVAQHPRGQLLAPLAVSELGHV